MNKIHPTIKFTHELRQETITFLDTDVHLDDNKLYVTTHINSTNKQAYTHASSYHPPGTGKGIAIGEANDMLGQTLALPTFKTASLNTSNKRKPEDIIYTIPENSSPI